MQLETIDHNAIDEMTEGFLSASLWTNEIESYEQFEPKSVSAVRGICERFYIENHDDLWEVGRERRDEYTKWECHGHDLWLTGQRHGVGYWDRGYGSIGDKLTKAAESTDLESWHVFYCEYENLVFIDYPRNGEN